VRQCTPPLDFFFSVSCLPQSFDVRMHSFLSHYWIPVLWWVNDFTVGALLKCFAPISVVACKHLFCNALWLTIFCALVFSDCACDMDHESAINELLLLLYFPGIYEPLSYSLGLCTFLVEFHVLQPATNSIISLQFLHLFLHCNH